MYKTVLRDYVSHVKDGMKNIFWSDWAPYFYFMVFAPAWSGGKDGYLVRQLYAMFFPIMIALLLSRMYGGVMSKTFFLCPLSEMQRKMYAKAGIHIRVAIPTVLFIVLNILVLVFYKIPFWMFLVRLGVFLSAAIVCNIYCQPVYADREKNERKYALVGNYWLWNVFLQVFTFVSTVILCSFEYNEKLWEFIIVGIFIAAQIFIGIKMIIKFYPQVINQATYYENQTGITVEKAKA